jgi:hypothetical protein
MENGDARSCRTGMGDPWFVAREPSNAAGMENGEWKLKFMIF